MSGDSFEVDEQYKYGGCKEDSVTSQEMASCCTIASAADVDATCPTRNAHHPAQPSRGYGK